jgi:DNA-binding NarL/FixJ family response regulator
MDDVRELVVRSGVERRRGSQRGGRRDEDPPVPLHTLTNQQRKVLEAIAAYHLVTGECCSTTYLARRLSLHHSTVQEHLWALFRKGWLRTPHAPTALRQPLG